MSEKPQVPESRMRRIRSFVMRPGRMTEGQKKAYSARWPLQGLSLADGLLDYSKVFSNEKPVVLEIGFGMGASLAEMAAADSDKNFIGVEVHKPGVGKLLQLCGEKSLDNIRVFEDDAVEVLAQCIPDASLGRIQIYFPDPWHKKKHHKRRLIQPGFVEQLANKLQPGGVLHLATDWQNYAEQMLEVLTDSSLQNLHDGYAPRPDYRPKTKFEARGERLGHGTWDLLFTKRGSE